MVFDYPMNTQIQDLRLYLNRDGEDIISASDISETYNDNVGTYFNNNETTCVGHFLFDESDTVDIPNQRPSKIISDNIRVPPSWSNQGHISKTTSVVNINRCPQTVFPSSSNYIHTYFSLAIPAEQQGKLLYIDLLTSTDTNQTSEWTIAYSFSLNSELTELKRIVTVYPNLGISKTTICIRESIPTTTELYHNVQGRLSRKPSTFSTILHGIQFYSIDYQVSNQIN